MRGCILLLGVVLVLNASVAAEEPLLELKVGDESYVGAAVAHDDKICWMAHADGQLTQVPLERVTSFRRVDDEFRGLSPLEARNALRRQLGRDWEIVGTGHYLVCVTSDEGRAYAQHFEDLYRSFRRYFTRRGFDLPEPKFPLIAIVYGNATDFQARCREDEIPCFPGLRGYYHRHTNRICLFENGEDFVSREQKGPRFPVPAFAFRRSSDALEIGARGVPVDASIQASLKETIVHEATHQLAFNLGLHSRIGQPPRWVVEGLATMFEADGTRRNTGGRPANERVNRERIWWFRQRQLDQQFQGTLVSFIATENAIRRSVLDFYAQAWALTFFLAETRPRQFADYLRAIGERDPLADYEAAERLEDFQNAFGRDLSRLETDMIRFIGDLD